MQFFLTELGEHKAILGYPWFTAVQPRSTGNEGGSITLNSPLSLKHLMLQKHASHHEWLIAPEVFTQNKSSYAGQLQH